MSSAGRGLGLLGLALITVAAIAVGSTAAPVRSGAQAGSMHNCPLAAKWSIAVWDGTGGTAADDALVACGADAVAAAYSLDAQTGAWSRWFAGKPDVSNLPPLGEVQGLLALGAAANPTPTPAATPTPTPSGPPGLSYGATYTGQTSQGLLVEFDVVADGLGIERVKFGFEGQLNGEPCEGLMNMTFGKAQPIVDNTFTINDTDYTLTGRFDSATTASGDLQVHIPDRWADPGCFGDPLTRTASTQ